MSNQTDQMSAVLALLQKLADKVEAMETNSSRVDAALASLSAVAGEQSTATVRVSGGSSQLVSERVAPQVSRSYTSSQVPVPVVEEIDARHELNMGDKEFEVAIGSLPVFSGKPGEYTDWYEQHHLLFERSGLVAFITGKEKEPNEINQIELHKIWYTKNLKCMYVFGKTVNKEIRQLYPTLHRNAPELWKQLRASYLKADEETLSRMQGRFHFHTFRPGMTLETYARSLIKVDAELRERGIITSDEDLRRKLLFQIPPQYHAIRYNLLHTPNLSFRDAANLLITESQSLEHPLATPQGNKGEGLDNGGWRQRQRGRNNGGQSQGNYGRQNPNQETNYGSNRGGGYDRTCHNCGKPGHIARFCSSQPITPSFTPKPCFICNKLSHHPSNCPLKNQVDAFVKTISSSPSQAHHTSDDHQIDSEFAQEN